MASFLIGYLLSDKVLKLYQQPLYLWGILPLLLYWFWRIWNRVKKGILHDDPLVFAVSDLQTSLHWLACLLISSHSFINEEVAYVTTPST